ncbi:MAG: M1 family aminopeptidase [Acidobacteriaceae bacterium]
MNFMRYGLSFILFLFAVGSSLGQSSGANNQNNSSSGNGQVLFFRGDSGTTTSETPVATSVSQQPATSPKAPDAPAKATLATDVERTSLTYSSYDFEVHLEPSQHSIAVQARLVVRNSSDKPLERIALQLSSSLHWESIQVDGKPAKFETETVDSDIDHTGELSEAVVNLGRPLAPGATMRVSVIYSGTVVPSAERLLRLGAPAKIANSSEWDAIDPEFTALRGFGNVIWFPVSTAPVLLGQGPEMFDSVGKWKLSESNAEVTMHVLVEYLDVKPTVASLNGSVVQPDGGSPQKPIAASVSPTSSKTTAQSAQSTSGESGGKQAPESATAPTTMAGNTILQVISFTLPSTRLGFAPLSLFVMSAAQESVPGLDIYSRADNKAAASTYQTVFTQTRPMIEQWLGAHPKRAVALVDLPDADDLPFEESNILFLPLKANATDDTVGPVMAHMLGHAYFVSPRVWLNEGVAQFMTLLWIEQRAGVSTAIGQMDSHRAALAIAETTDPGVNPGQSLIEAWNDIYYRDKATDVLWMLRNIVGDEALGKALQAYVPAEDHEPSYFQTLLQKASNKDLEWFFDDWVYRDTGLPDLHIVSAYWRPILNKNSSGKNYLVSVDVQNDSFCAAEVPVTVSSAFSSQSRELLIPAHARAALRMLLDSKPAQVVVNDGSVPEVESSHHEQTVVPAQ